MTSDYISFLKVRAVAFASADPQLIREFCRKYRISANLPDEELLAKVKSAPVWEVADWLSALPKTGERLKNRKTIGF